jgi:hypothetical protein
METITFIDAEIEPQRRKVLDIGAIKADGSVFHSCSVSWDLVFLQGLLPGEACSIGKAVDICFKPHHFLSYQDLPYPH